MRCNQVSIFIERFGEYVPKGYPAETVCSDGAEIIRESDFERLRALMG